MTEKKEHVYIGDILPTYYNAVIFIFPQESRPGSDHMNNIINLYVSSLANVWTTAFGQGHIITRKTIVYRLQKAVTW